LGIYIKDMKMPANCKECLAYDHEQFDCFFDTRECPIVPVQAHGRLIDADALKASLAFAEKTAEWAVPALRAVLMIIDETPTIIPAEEG